MAGKSRNTLRRDRKIKVLNQKNHSTSYCIHDGLRSYFCATLKVLSLNSGKLRLPAFLRFAIGFRLVEGVTLASNTNL